MIRFPRRLGLVIGLLVLAAGLGTLFWPYLDRVVGQRLLADRVAVDMRVTVVSDAGATVPNRLVVVFVEG